MKFKYVAMGVAGFTAIIGLAFAVNSGVVPFISVDGAIAK